MNNLIGSQLDHYRIEALLGEGGMGIVYRAFDQNLALPVALKVMHPHLAKQSQFKQRFMQEAQAAARLRHPSIVNIKYFGVKQGLLFMVMDLVSGPSLGAYVRQQGPLKRVIPLGETLLIVAQVAEALDYAHRQGVVHRDVKPDNVLIQPLDEPEHSGEPALWAMVTDFGLAKLLEGGIETGTGSFLGTMPYMSPEQCLGVDLDGRSDIYSLGIMLYQFATGRLPFEIKTPAEAAEKHLRGIPPDPRTIQPGLPESVEAIIRKAIAKEPGDRYQRAADLASDIRQAAAGLTEADITLFTQQNTVVSLVTQLKNLEAIDEPSRMDFNSSAAEAGDLLLVAHKNHTPLTIPLDKTSLSIGREGSNDIVLPEEGVSRRHARLERTGAGWQVTDLRSTNGTTIDGQKLLPDMPEAWNPDQTLRIGAYFLHWKRAAGPVPGDATTAWLSALPGSTQVQSASQHLSLTIHPTEMSLEPGKQARVQAEIFHTGSTVEHFRLNVDGLPASWITLPPESLQLMPGGRAIQEITIHPPQHSSVRAGAHAYRVVVQAGAGRHEAAAVPAMLEVLPFEKFSVDMQPSRLSSGGKSKVTISNQGNIESLYSIVGRDPAEQVRFDGLRGRLKVSPGQTLTQDLTVAAKKRPLMGNRSILPFEVQVHSKDNAQQRLAGELDVRPIIPWWMLSVLGMLTLCMCVAAFFVFNLGIFPLKQAGAGSGVANLPAGSVVTSSPTATDVIGGAGLGDGVPGLEATLTFTPQVSLTDTPVPSPTETNTPMPTATGTLAAPVAQDDSLQVSEDEPGTIDVLANDSDSDGGLDPASISISSPPSHGSANPRGAGSLEYIPEPNYNGPDSFTYQVCDIDGLCVTAAVLVEVAAINDPPTANDDSGYQGDEDNPMSVGAPGVLANDDDPDRDGLAALVETQPAHGDISMKADGSFTYSPDANYCGSDSFTYSASDGNGGVGTGEVTLNVQCVPDRPVANKDIYNNDAIEDTVYKVSAPGVLENDVDVDQGQKLTARRVENAQYGNVVVNENGGFTYTPNQDFCSSKGRIDVFKYEVSDGVTKPRQAEAVIVVRCVSERVKYRITVKTGDREDAGTDAAVFIMLSGTEESTLPAGYKLAKSGVDDHERGKVYDYTIETNEGIGELSYADIWLANGDNENTDGWFMEWVEITRLDNGKSMRFTCNQWFDANSSGNITRRRLQNGGCR